MFEELKNQQQWQIEADLGDLISQLRANRFDLEIALQKAHHHREREAKLLEEISAHRRELGLPDPLIVDLISPHELRSDCSTQGMGGLQACPEPTATPSQEA